MEEDLPPARKVVTRSPVRTVRVLNLKGVLAHPIEAESTLERDFVYRAALCPTVTEIRHQPFQFSLGAGRRYTPDFLVQHADGPTVVVEVKPQSNIAGYRDVFDEVAARMRQRGTAFHVVSEAQIRHEKRHQRAARLLRYRKAPPPRQTAFRLLDILTSRGTATSEELLSHVGCDVAAIYYLIVTHQLFVSADLPIGQQAIISKEFDHALRIDGWFGVTPWSTNDGDRQASGR